MDQTILKDVGIFPDIAIDAAYGDGSLIQKKVVIPGNMSASGKMLQIKQM